MKNWNIEMSETTKGQKREAGLSRPGKLELKKTVESERSAELLAWPVKNGSGGEED